MKYVFCFGEIIFVNFMYNNKVYIKWLVREGILCSCEVVEERLVWLLFWFFFVLFDRLLKLEIIILKKNLDVGLF